MGRLRRRRVKLLTVIVLVAAAYIAGVATYPLLPKTVKDAAAIERSDIQAVSNRLDDLFSPTPAVGPTLEEQRVFLLELINRDRAANGGFPPVELGTNTAAQEHAEEMLEYSYLSHWGLDGLKPYMRYALAGGTAYEAENISGIDEPPEEGARYRRTSAKSNIRQAQRGFMNSPGHRRNVLNPWHTKVSPGIACNDYTCAVVQQFEASYIEFDGRPAIDSGVLTVSGRTLSPFTLDQVDIWYEQLPRPLSLSQLDITYCYNGGDIPVAFIRPPPPPNTFYPAGPATFEWESCRDPYLADPERPRNTPMPSGTVLIPVPSLLNNSRSETVPWITADQWNVSGSAFSVKVNLSRVLAKNGPGVYTVTIWGESGEEVVPLANHPLFVE